MMVHSNECRDDMFYREARRNLEEAVHLFKAAYSDRPVDITYIRHLVT